MIVENSKDSTKWLLGVKPVHRISIPKKKKKKCISVCTRNKKLEIENFKHTLYNSTQSHKVLRYKSYKICLCAENNILRKETKKTLKNEDT